MLSRVQRLSPARRLGLARATLLVGAIAVLAGCGSTVGSSPTARASTDPDPPASSAGVSCSATVLDTDGRVLERVYHEGVSSERTASAQHLIAGSAALREAVERGSAASAREAARALVATGHMTNLRVTRGGRTLVDVGGPALAPIQGTIGVPGGVPIASYVTSVWADSGFVAEADGVARGLVAVRANGRSVGGSASLPHGALPSEGMLMRRHVAYQYTSFPAQAYPSGAVRIYVLVPVATTAQLCGSTSEDTVVNTLAHIANLIYAGERGARTLTQIRRVQRDPALLSAVARHEPVAARQAVEALLHKHLVRLRVSAAGQLLADVGGPYVLAPVKAPLVLRGRRIGSLELSIQDDEGYKRLTGRLVGVDVLMYMGSQLVKNSLGPAPGNVPASGPFQYHGRNFRVFTVHAEAFPSGPLVIRVLVPIPYR